MKRKDVICPLCGHKNKGVDLEESDGWAECENCGNDFAPSESLDKVLQTTASVLNFYNRDSLSLKNNKQPPTS